MQKTIFKIYEITLTLTTLGLSTAKQMVLSKCCLPYPLHPVQDRYSLQEPITLQVYKWFEFIVFFLLDRFPYKVKEPSLPNYLPIAGGRILGFIPIIKVLFWLWFFYFCPHLVVISNAMFQPLYPLAFLRCPLFIWAYKWFNLGNNQM